MIYKAIGLMSGSSLDGLDIAYVHLQETGGKWSFDILHADCYPYDEELAGKLKNATGMNALDYQLLHTAYGHYTGEQVKKFIDAHNLHHKVDLIASHGHTTFHRPAQKMTGQLGDGAAIAAVTKLPVVSDLRALDVAFGGHGAPIVPIGEKLLLSQYPLLLNLGGIANLSVKTKDTYIAFDVCAANRVLNMLAERAGKTYDENGDLASAGSSQKGLLADLEALEYYKIPYPKSLANDFGTDVVYPIVKNFTNNNEDALRTYVEHICQQVSKSIPADLLTEGRQMLATGGGANNTFLMKRLGEVLAQKGIDLVVPDKNLVNYKEALIMALIGVLRWREEYNVMASVTGASQNSIGGALWLGVEA